MITINAVLPDMVLKELEEVAGSGGKSLDELVDEAVLRRLNINDPRSQG